MFLCLTPASKEEADGGLRGRGHELPHKPSVASDAFEEERALPQRLQSVSEAMAELRCQRWPLRLSWTAETVTSLRGRGWPQRWNVAGELVSGLRGCAWPQRPRLASGIKACFNIFCSTLQKLIYSCFCYQKVKYDFCLQNLKIQLAMQR